jgi:hypothetical protein
MQKIFVLMISLSAFLFCSCDKGKKEPEKQEAATSAAKPAREAPVAKEAPTAKAEPAALPDPDFTIEARALYAEFRPSIEAGKKDIKEKYTGKIVRISGEVKTNSAPAEITLKANDKLGQAFCGLAAASKEKAKALKTGDKVTLQCTSTGWLIGPAFKECVLVP